MSCNHVHVNLARVVSASSPVRRRGSILNLAPSSSPTPISWPGTGSKGPLLLCCHRATAAATTGRAPRIRRDAGRRARGRDIMVGGCVSYFFGDFYVYDLVEENRRLHPASWSLCRFWKLVVKRMQNVCLAQGPVPS